MGYMGRPPIDTIEIKGTDRIAIHTVSSGSAWALVLGPRPYTKRGGTSSWKKVEALGTGRKIAGSIKGSKDMVLYAVKVLARIAGTGDAQGFLYALELRQELVGIHEETMGMDLKQGKQARSNAIDGLFCRLGKEVYEAEKIAQGHGLRS